MVDLRYKKSYLCLQLPTIYKYPVHTRLVFTKIVALGSAVEKAQDSYAGGHWFESYL